MNIHVYNYYKKNRKPGKYKKYKSQYRYKNPRRRYYIKNPKEKRPFRPKKKITECTCYNCGKLGHFAQIITKEEYIDEESQCFDP